MTLSLDVCTLFPGISPYFESTVTSITISSSESIGNTVHTLTVTDDDTDDVSSLIVSLATNDYFDVNGTGIYIFNYNDFIIID